ncbi:MAG: acetyl-CoA carboxylase biotin carboxylase subunit [Sphaerobacter sp.]|nr:acetyl-CoA carboxylase biotin carboxylase subunit [Sphaerobacter sp.]
MRKVLVANRGEIAVRVIRACRELGIPTVAVYSEADVDALHVRQADEAVLIGPAPATRSYLDAEALLAAARQTGADAIHPGYGFLAENAAFAAACAEAGITFIGPSAEAIRRLGDKAAARRIAIEAGVPVVPGSDGVVAPEDAAAEAARLGYPVMIKAAAGGGGQGIRIVDRPEDFPAALEAARREARAAFGDESIYLERRLIHPRHVEVQVLADHHGTVLHLFERECSLQRRRQKVLEEAPSPGIDAATRAQLTAAAVRLAAAVGYTNAGTFEFLVDAQGFYFIEANTRIQVEHPITEAITGIDLVKAQIRLAAGEPLWFRQEDVQPRGWAIEFRVNAEDPDLDFFPSPGQVTALEVPGGPGVRIDSALYAGYEVPPFYDSLVGKLIVWGADRAEAIQRGRRALREYRVEGIRTTIPLHQRLLEEPDIVTGNYHAGWLERYLAAPRPAAQSA